jgi:hypothetical protein
MDGKWHTLRCSANSYTELDKLLRSAGESGWELVTVLQAPIQGVYSGTDQLEWHAYLKKFEGY